MKLEISEIVARGDWHWLRDC